MAINIGAPIKAVKIPIGISEGAAIVLLIVSAESNKMLPKIADIGRMI